MKKETIIDVMGRQQLQYLYINVDCRSEMLNYRYTHLPLPFVQLLASNMQTGGTVFPKLKSHIESHPDMKSILARAVSDIDPEARLEKVIHSIGWLGVRDRIAAMYLQRRRDGVYPYEPDLTIVKELNLFEGRTKDYCVDGFSRSYLFAFYFKMSMLEQIQEGSHLKLSDELISQDVIQLLTKTKAKVIHIDWILLVLQQLKIFWGIDHLNLRLTSNFAWKEIYNELNNKQQKELIDNLLSYGASVAETDFFTAEMI